MEVSLIILILPSNFSGLTGCLGSKGEFFSKIMVSPSKNQFIYSSSRLSINYFKLFFCKNTNLKSSQKFGSFFLLSISWQKFFCVLIFFQTTKQSMSKLPHWIFILIVSIQKPLQTAFSLLDSYRLRYMRIVRIRVTRFIIKLIQSITSSPLVRGSRHRLTK